MTNYRLVQAILDLNEMDTKVQKLYLAIPYISLSIHLHTRQMTHL